MSGAGELAAHRHPDGGSGERRRDSGQSAASRRLRRSTAPSVRAEGLHRLDTRRFGAPVACCKSRPCSLPNAVRECRPGARSGTASRPDQPHWRLRKRPLVRAPPAAPMRDSQRHHHLAGVHLDLIGSQMDLAKREALSTGDVVLEAVPGAGDDLSVKPPLSVPSGLSTSDCGPVHAPALAQRPCLVRANVRQSVEPPPDIENADLSISDPHKTMTTLRKLLYSPNYVLRVHPALGSGVIARRRRRITAWRQWVASAEEILARRPCLSMAKRRSAFSPKILRLTSSENGTWATLEGWSKSWCGQSDANTT